MKKIIAITLSLTLALTLSLAYAEDMTDRGEFYPLLTIVIDKDYSEQWPIVICEDKQGNIWTFYDDIDIWQIGDIANILMWNMGGNIEDDEVVEVYYEGHIENMEWR